MQLLYIHTPICLHGQLPLCLFALNVFQDLSVYKTVHSWCFCSQPMAIRTACCSKRRIKFLLWTHMVKKVLTFIEYSGCIVMLIKVWLQATFWSGQSRFSGSRLFEITFFFNRCDCRQGHFFILGTEYSWSVYHFVVTCPADITVLPSMSFIMCFCVLLCVRVTGVLISP